MTLAKGFSYQAEPNAERLILGSMPGLASLQAQRYYANARNQFWPILLSVFGQPPDLTYEQRLSILRERRIALWDVLAECERPGSLDADIELSSVRANNFVAFYEQHRSIRCIVFNGAAARKLYQRFVYPTLNTEQKAIPQHVLPSTSPAHASVRFDEKRRRWRDILE